MLSVCINRIDLSSEISKRLSDTAPAGKTRKCYKFVMPSPQTNSSIGPGSQPKEAVPWRRRLEPYSLVIALALILVWGCNFSVQKYVFSSNSPNGVLLLRYGVLMPICSVLLLLVTYGWAWPKLNRADALTLFKLGFIGHLLHVGLVTHGRNLSAPFSSSLMIACGPIFTLLLLRFMILEKLQRSSSQCPLGYLMAPVAGLVSWLSGGKV
jgi:drug/metabolite transporter (DMT)-like permease